MSKNNRGAGGASTPELRVFASLDALNFALAEAVASTINTCVRAQERCAIALAGGDTPRGLYTLLATDFKKHVPWKRVHVFWGDERLVPAGDPRRNDRMARETLLDRVPCPKRQIHPMATRAHQSPADAAREYEDTMRQHFVDGRPRFDLVLLGMGAEGHTASLFPQSPALDEQDRWVSAVTVPADPSDRLTLTLPVFNCAANVYFLVTGAAKGRALNAAMDPATDPRTCPAAGVRPADGKLTWWADAPAAGARRDEDLQKGAVEEAGEDPIVSIPASR